MQRSAPRLILNKVQVDFIARGLTYSYPSVDKVTGNKDTFRQKIEAIIADIAKGKDKSKLRIIIHG